MDSPTSPFDPSNVYELGSAWSIMGDLLNAMSSAINGSVDGVVWVGGAGTEFATAWQSVKSAIDSVAQMSWNIGEELNDYGTQAANYEAQYLREQETLGWIEFFGGLLSIFTLPLLGVLGAEFAALADVLIEEVADQVGTIIITALRFTANAVVSVADALRNDLLSQWIASEIEHTDFSFNWRNEVYSLVPAAVFSLFGDFAPYSTTIKNGVTSLFNGSRDIPAVPHVDVPEVTPPEFNPAIGSLAPGDLEIKALPEPIPAGIVSVGGANPIVSALSHSDIEVAAPVANLSAVGNGSGRAVEDLGVGPVAVVRDPVDSDPVLVHTPADNPVVLTRDPAGLDQTVHLAPPGDTPSVLRDPILPDTSVHSPVSDPAVTRPPGESAIAVPDAPTRTVADAVPTTDVPPARFGTGLDSAAHDALPLPAATVEAGGGRAEAATLAASDAGSHGSPAPVSVAEDRTAVGVLPADSPAVRDREVNVPFTRSSTPSEGDERSIIVIPESEHGDQASMFHSPFGDETSSTADSFASSAAHQTAAGDRSGGAASLASPHIATAHEQPVLAYSSADHGAPPPAEHAAESPAVDPPADPAASPAANLSGYFENLREVRWEAARGKIWDDYEGRFGYTSQVERVQRAADYRFEANWQRYAEKPGEPLSEHGVAEVRGAFERDVTSAFEQRFAHSDQGADSGADHVAAFSPHLDELVDDLPARLERQAVWESRRDAAHAAFDGKIAAHPALLEREKLFGSDGLQRSDQARAEAWRREHIVEIDVDADHPIPDGPVEMPVRYVSSGAIERAEAWRETAWSDFEGRLRGAFDSAVADGGELRANVIRRFDELVEQVPQAVDAQLALVHALHESHAVVDDLRVHVFGDPPEDVWRRAQYGAEHRIETDFEDVFGSPFRGGRPEVEKPGEQWALRRQDLTGTVQGIFARVLRLDTKLDGLFEESAATWAARHGTASEPVLDAAREAFTADAHAAYQRVFRSLGSGNDAEERAWQAELKQLRETTLPAKLSHEAAFEHEYGGNLRAFESAYDSWIQRHGATLSPDAEERLRTEFGRNLRGAFDEVYLAPAERWSRFGGPDEAWRTTLEHYTDRLDRLFDAETHLTGAFEDGATRFAGFTERFQVNEQHAGELGDSLRTDLATSYRDIWQIDHRDLGAWLEHEKLHEDAFGTKLASLRQTREDEAAASSSVELSHERTVPDEHDAVEQIEIHSPANDSLIRHPDFDADFDEAVHTSPGLGALDQVQLVRLRESAHDAWQSRFDAAESDARGAAGPLARRFVERGWRSDYELSLKSLPQRAEFLKRTADNEKQLAEDMAGLSEAWLRDGVGSDAVHDATTSLAQAVRADFARAHQGMADTGLGVSRAAWGTRYQAMVGRSDTWLSLRALRQKALKTVEVTVSARLSASDDSHHDVVEQQQLRQVEKQFVATIETVAGRELRRATDWTLRKTDVAASAQRFERGLREALTDVEDKWNARLDAQPAVLAAIPRFTHATTAAAVETKAATSAQTDAERALEWEQQRAGLIDRYQARIVVAERVELRRPDAAGIYRYVMRNASGLDVVEASRLPSQAEFVRRVNDAYDETWHAAVALGSEADSPVWRATASRWQRERGRLAASLATQARVEVLRVSRTREAQAIADEVRSQWPKAHDELETALRDETLADFKARALAYFDQLHVPEAFSGRLDVNAPVTYDEVLRHLELGLDVRRDALRTRREYAVKASQHIDSILAEADPATAQAAAEHIRELKRQASALGRGLAWETKSDQVPTQLRPEISALFVRTRTALALARLRPDFDTRISAATRTAIERGAHPAVADGLAEVLTAAVERIHHEIGRSVESAEAAESALRTWFGQTGAATETMLDFEADVRTRTLDAVRTARGGIDAHSAEQTLAALRETAWSLYDKALAEHWPAGAPDALRIRLAAEAADLEQQLVFDSNAQAEIDRVLDETEEAAGELGLDEDGAQRVVHERAAAARDVVAAIRGDLAARRFDLAETENALARLGPALDALIEDLPTRVAAEPRLIQAVRDAGEDFMALAAARDLSEGVRDALSSDFRHDWVSGFARTLGPAVPDLEVWLPHEAQAADRFARTWQSTHEPAPPAEVPAPVLASVAESVAEPVAEPAPVLAERRFAFTTLLDRMGGARPATEAFSALSGDPLTARRAHAELAGLGADLAELLRATLHEEGLPLEATRLVVEVRSASAGAAAVLQAAVDRLGHGIELADLLHRQAVNLCP